jgi:hypothetical protein
MIASRTDDERQATREALVQLLADRRDRAT